MNSPAVPPGYLLIELQYDRHSGVHSYEIHSAGFVISQDLLNKGRLLQPGESTRVQRTRGSRKATIIITNQGGNPTFWTRRRRRDWWEELLWRF